MGLFNLVTFASSKIEKLGRAQGPSVVGTAAGDNERDFDSEIFATHGIVSRPSTKTRGVRIRIGNLGIVLGAYTYGVEPPTNPGACKLYSTDADGTEQASHLLDADGKHTFNNGTDFAVRYSKLEIAFDKLKSDFNALVTAYNAHVHTGVTTGSGSSAITPSQGVASTADITPAKVQEIKLP